MFKIEYADEVKEHVKYLTASEAVAVRDQVMQQLSYEPEKETRNRKKMRPNQLATWELRIGHLRVYYEIGVGSDPSVKILAIGKKDRDQVLIGGQVIKL